MINHKKVTLDNVTWTPITPGADCYHCEINNITGVVMKIRTDQADANTEVSIQSLQVYEITPPDSGRNLTMHATQTLCYAQLSSGSAVVTIKSTK